MSVRKRWRQPAALILVVLGCLAATVSVPAVWLNRVVLDTDTYVETVAPLSQDPAVKDAVARSATDQFFKRVNVSQLAHQALPGPAAVLADPLAGTLQGFVYGQVRRALDLPVFSKLWQSANRQAHDLVLGVLTGKSKAVTAGNNEVYLNLDPLLASIKQNLAARGITIFENVNVQTGARFPLFHSQRITPAQGAIRLLNRLALWLPLLALALWAVGLWLAAGRRAALLGIGLGLAAGMVLLDLGLTLGRDAYLGTVSRNGALDLAAATSFFDIIVRNLRTAIKAVFAAGLLLAAGAYLAGPSSPAVTVRRAGAGIYRAARATGGRLNLGPAGAWIRGQKNILRGAGLVAALVSLIAADRLTAARFLTVAGILLAYLAALEFIARRSA